MLHKIIVFREIRQASISRRILRHRSVVFRCLLAGSPSTFAKIRIARVLGFCPPPMMLVVVRLVRIMDVSSGPGLNAAMHARRAAATIVSNQTLLWFRNLRAPRRSIDAAGMLTPVRRKIARTRIFPWVSTRRFIARLERPRKAIAGFSARAAAPRFRTDPRHAATREQIARRTSL